MVPIAAALALMAYMNFERFAKTYGEVSRSRAEAVLLDALEAVESGLTLGLAASSLTSLQGTLTRYAENDDGVLGLAVVDADGTVAIASAGTKLDGVDVASAKQASGVAAVPTATQGVSAVVVPVRDAQGVRAGTLALIYSTAEADAALAQVRRLLAMLAGGIALACGLVALALASRVLRPVSAEFNDMSRRLAEIRPRRGEGGYGKAVAGVVLGDPGKTS
jgi:hypothetical protein